MPNHMAVVTGGTGGIGRATALGLVSKGLDVIIVGHNEERGRRVAAEIQQQARGGRVRFEAADLSALDEVRALAARLVEQVPQLNVVVHNFGAMYAQRRVTRDGYEATFATNVLTPLVLSYALLPPLAAGAPSRMVFVSSDAHRFAKADLNDLNAERFYRGFDAYGRAKLLQLLVARHLSTRFLDHNISVLMVNPGGAWTEQIAAMKASMMPPKMRIMWPMIRLVQRRRSPETAAQPIIRAATDPALLGRTNVWIDQSNKLGEPSATARDDVLAAQVHERFAGLVGGLEVG